MMGRTKEMLDDPLYGDWLTDEEIHIMEQEANV